MYIRRAGAFSRRFCFGVYGSSWAPTPTEIGTYLTNPCSTVFFASRGLFQKAPLFPFLSAFTSRFFLRGSNIPFIHIITSIRFFRIFASSETFHLYICWILKKKKEKRIKMETEELIIGRVHHGRNIRRTRIEKNIKQEALSKSVHLSQPAISKYEKMKVIDDEMLQRFARALNVPFDYLKTLEEDAQTVVFENITNNGNAGANANIGFVDEVGEDNRS